MAPTVDKSFGCDERVDTSVRCAPGEVAMLSRNTTNKAAAPIAATDALGQFLKVCIMLSTRLIGGLYAAPHCRRRARRPCVFVEGAGIDLYELAHTEGCLLAAVWRHHTQARFGSKVDVMTTKIDVRFTPLKADMCSANRYVRFVPLADIQHENQKTSFSSAMRFSTFARNA